MIIAKKIHNNSDRLDSKISSPFGSRKVVISRQWGKITKDN